MRFTVPVHFNLTATRIGGERKQSTQAWSLAEIDVPDLSGDDVPVVLSWNQEFEGFRFLETNSAAVIGATPVGKPRHIRKFGETFLRPVMCRVDDNGSTATFYGERADFLTAASVDSMLGRLESASIFGSAMPSGVHLRRLKENGGNGLADFASVEHLNLDRMVAELTKRMRDKYLLIDGVFYERCPEPVLAVFRTNVMYYDLKETAALVAVTTDPYPLNRVDSRAETFPIEDYMAALKMANRRNAGNRFAPVFAEINLQNLPEIDPHDSIYAADVAWMRRANRVAVEVAARLGELRASAMTDGLYSAYSRLVKALHTNEDDARFDTMAEIFAEVARECRGTDLDTLADHAESGLAVVEARPVSLNFGASSPVVGP